MELVVRVGHRWWRAAGRAASWWGAATLGAALACSSGTVFLCQSSAQCGDSGTCEASGHCSFPDGVCPSGRRYGEHASPDLANACVAVPTPSGEPSGGSTSTTRPPVVDESGGDDTRGTTTAAVAESTGEPLPYGTTTTGEPPASETTDGSTSSGSSTGATVERTTEGIVVLYLFDEGRGTTVFDRSEVDPPLDMVIEGAGATWTMDGLALDGAAIVRAPDPPSKVLDRCQASAEITVEAWITPEAALMQGPGRIVTLSESSSDRNVTVGQGLHNELSAHYVARLRTNDETGTNNGLPQLLTDPIAQAVLTHLAYTRSAEGIDRLYVNGELEAEGPRTGTFANWSAAASLACGNELTQSRPWNGTLHLVAIYDRALSADAIVQNITAGL